MTGFFFGVLWGSWAPKKCFEMMSNAQLIRIVLDVRWKMMMIEIIIIEK